MPKTIVIYHGNCADGFGAAWVVRKAYAKQIENGEVEFFAGIYGNPPPDVTGKNVVMVDFSYKKNVLAEMIGASAVGNDTGFFTVIDHHKTAQEDLAGLDGFRPGVEVHFDMEHSGAMLAWNWFFPHDEAPMLLRHIEDRDLWKFRLVGTREIQSALFSYPYDFEVWDKLMANHEHLMDEGRAIERKHFKDINELLGVVTRPMKIGGHLIEVANLPYTFSSDAGHTLAKRNPFGACYYDTPKGRCFSLRSTDEGVDVGQIAKAYGGGGHRNASGFMVPFAEAAAFEIV